MQMFVRIGDPPILLAQSSPELHRWASTGENTIVEASNHAFIFNRRSSRGSLTRLQPNQRSEMCLQTFIKILFIKNKRWK